jgi:hypothetical protein
VDVMAATSLVMLSTMRKQVQTRVWTHRVLRMFMQGGLAKVGVTNLC